MHSSADIVVGAGEYYWWGQSPKGFSLSPRFEQLQTLSADHSSKPAFRNPSRNNSINSGVW